MHLQVCYAWEFDIEEGWWTGQKEGVLNERGVQEGHARHMSTD